MKEGKEPRSKLLEEARDAARLLNLLGYDKESVSSALSLDAWLGDKPWSLNGHDGQTLRMEHTMDGCSLILELPRTHFAPSRKLVGCKMIGGAEMIFEYRLTRNGLALYELLPSPPELDQEQDQQVLWLGGPMPVLGETSDDL